MGISETLLLLGLGAPVLITIDIVKDIWFMVKARNQSNDQRQTRYMR